MSCYSRFRAVISCLYVKASKAKTTQKIKKEKKNLENFKMYDRLFIFYFIKQVKS